MGSENLTKGRGRDSCWESLWSWDHRGPACLCPGLSPAALNTPGLQLCNQNSTGWRDQPASPPTAHHLPLSTSLWGSQPGKGPEWRGSHAPQVTEPRGLRHSRALDCTPQAPAPVLPCSAPGPARSLCLSAALLCGLGCALEVAWMKGLFEKPNRDPQPRVATLSPWPGMSRLISHHKVIHSVCRPSVCMETTSPFRQGEGLSVGPTLCTELGVRPAHLTPDEERDLLTHQVWDDTHYFRESQQTVHGALGGVLSGWVMPPTHCGCWALHKLILINSQPTTLSPRAWEMHPVLLAI